MMVPIFFGLGLVPVASLVLAIPVPQYQEPWSGVFLPQQPYDTPSNGPYVPYVIQAPPPQHPGDPQPYYGGPLPPPSTQTPYTPETAERPIHPPGGKPGSLPPNYGSPNYGSTYEPPPPTTNSPPFRPYPPHPRVSQAPPPPPARPAAPPKKAVDVVTVEETPQKQKLNPPPRERPPTAKDAEETAPRVSPAKEMATAQQNKPASGTDEGSMEENSMRYHVNVGGIQKGAGGGTTNFHVYTDENGTKKFSDELDPETERYITENMIPKFGNKRKKGSGVWSVFGGK